MDKTIEKEFSIGDLLNLLVTRNDSNSLDSVLEMKFTSVVPTKHILVMSFYNEEKNQISQKNLTVRCNYKNILFDNILLISNLKADKNTQDYKLKFLNKNIYYMKFYIQTYNIINQSEYSFSQVFNLKQMKILSKEEIKHLSLNNDINNKNNLNNSIDKSNSNKSEQNNNLNMILSELDKINKSLTERQIDLDEKENMIKERENHIGKQKKLIEQKIIQFKEEILLFGDKCYGECVNEINNKMQKLNKKITTVENNITNKYRILKDKLNNNKQNISSNSNNLVSQEKKEKIANLEIKIKFLEDSLNKLKEKNVENEEKIKNYVAGEEKLNITIKKLKDELILTNSQLKEKEKKNKMNNINSSNMSISNISYIDNKDNVSLSSMLSKVKNKKKTNIISFDIDKYQKEIISKYFVYNFILEYKIIPNNSIDKEILTAAILLMHLSTNPIELYNKFELGHIIILHKLIYNIYLNNINSYQYLLKESLNDLYNKIPEFKNNISVFISNNKRRYFEFNPLVELNIILASSSIIDKTGNNSLINEINFSNIIFNKCVSFNNFISKSNLNISKITSNNNNNINNERKNKIKKYTIVSNLIISIIFSSNFQELISIIKKIMLYFSNSNKDKEIINFLIKIKIGKLLILVFQKISHNNENFSDKNDNNDNEMKELIKYIIDCLLFIMAYTSSNYNSNNMNEQIDTNNNCSFNIEKDIGLILWENKFVDYIKCNIKDYLNYYTEIKNNPLNKFVSVDQNYYDTIKNNFLKCIVLITNLSIYCSNLRIKIKEVFIDNIISIQNIFKNYEKNNKEDKWISYTNRNISHLSKIININMNN